jgi:hypothetical protein
MLALTLTRSGPVRILVHDLGGRVVRRVLDAESLPAGLTEVPLISRHDPMPTGVYFFTVHTGEGERRGRFVVLR